MQKRPGNNLDSVLMEVVVVEDGQSRDVLPSLLALLVQIAERQKKRRAEAKAA